MTTARKNLTMNEYLDSLLEIRTLIDESMTEHVKEKTNFSGMEKLLTFETKIFSLWLVSLTIKDREIKEMFHQRFCNQVGLNRLQTQMVYERTRICYANYNYAFGCWVKNPRSGHVLGGVMAEILVNQNSDFSAEEKLPMVDADIALNMFMFFSDWFKNTLDLIVKLQEKFVLPVLN